MYMELRYPEQCPSNDTAESLNNIHPNMPDIFLLWNAEDPVSDYEKQYNSVLEKLQGNRNPFIDNPYLATLIWGGGQAENTWGLELNVPYLASNSFTVYPTVVDNRLYIFHSSESPIEKNIYSISGESLDVRFFEDHIDVSNLSKGIYILKLRNSVTESIFKFIKK